MTAKVVESSKKGGRVKGTPNKKTQDVIDRLKELNCDPIEGMARIAMSAATCLSRDSLGFMIADQDKPEDKDVCTNCDGLGKLAASLELRGQMYKELAQYVAPKRKAIEMSGPDGGPQEHQQHKWEVEIKDTTNA